MMKEAHKHIFEAIVQLFTETQPIDLLTVSLNWKKKIRFGWVDFLPDSAYARFFFGAYWISLQSFSKNLFSAVWFGYHQKLSKILDETTDVFDLLDRAESKLYEVTQGNIEVPKRRRVLVPNQKTIEIMVKKDWVVLQLVW
jgi:replicative DNA helicase